MRFELFLSALEKEAYKKLANLAHLFSFGLCKNEQKIMHQSKFKITGVALTFTSHNLMGKEIIISHLCAALQTDFCKPAGHSGTQSNFFL